MSEVNTTPTEPAANEPTAQQGGSTYTPPATQADLDRIIENRLQRDRESRDKKYSDYDQLKQQAGQLASVVAERDSLKSQLDSANSELNAFKVNDQKRQWAAEVAKETGVPADVLRGDTKEELEAHANSLKPFLQVAAPYVGGDGKQPGTNAKPSIQESFSDFMKTLI